MSESVTPARVFEFDELSDADLVIDAVYRGGRSKHVGDDPIARLLPVGNQGGFRYQGSVKDNAIDMVVLYSSGDDPDWPDHLDMFTGRFVYFGDNKKPGHELHDTPRGGNKILRHVFEVVHEVDGEIPPFFVFEKTGTGRDVRFRGLAVPGNPQVSGDSDLVAIWRSTNNERFQNYRAVFTVLDAAVIDRQWLNDLAMGKASSSEHSPSAWKLWALRRRYAALEAPRTVSFRSPAEQVPPEGDGKRILEVMHSFFQDQPTAFEACAARIWAVIEPNASDMTITQASRDGGRDAIGRHHLGPPGDRVVVDFALEAKCYASGNSVGVKEMSRLISRLLHRQYGVLVTTSHVAPQAYQEIREDGHPVVVVAGVDIVAALRTLDIGTPDEVHAWLVQNFKH